jgi:WD40 repeat protein
MSALQDPSSAGPITDQVRKNVASHRQPVLCIRWFPSGLELEMKKSFSVLVSSPSTDINQFATISSDGQVLLWDRRFQDAQKKTVTDVN